MWNCFPSGFNVSLGPPGAHMDDDALMQQAMLASVQEAEAPPPPTVTHCFGSQVPSAYGETAAKSSMTVRAPYGAEVISSMIKRADLPSKLKILDARCGTGLLSKQLADAFLEADVIGCDNSPDMLKMAKESQGGMGCASAWVTCSNCRLTMGPLMLLY